MGTEHDSKLRFSRYRQSSRHHVGAAVPSRSRRGRAARSPPTRWSEDGHSPTLVCEPSLGRWGARYDVKSSNSIKKGDFRAYGHMAGSEAGSLAERPVQREKLHITMWSDRMLSTHSALGRVVEDAEGDVFATGRDTFPIDRAAARVKLDGVFLVDLLECPT